MRSRYVRFAPLGMIDTEETIAQAHLLTVSPPCPPLGRITLPKGGFSGLFGALEHKKPRHTLQIVCHSFQDILCMRSLKPSVATPPS